MLRLTLITAATVLLTASSALAKDTQFWNLTVDTITKFQLSPAGKAAWGADQTRNDKDGSVDPDERLKITGVAAGVYDAKFTDKKGRTCIVSNVTVEAGKIFSISEKQLTNCQK